MLRTVMVLEADVLNCEIQLTRAASTTKHTLQDLGYFRMMNPTRKAHLHVLYQVTVDDRNTTHTTKQGELLAHVPFSTHAAKPKATYAPNSDPCASLMYKKYVTMKAVSGVW